MPPEWGLLPPLYHEGPEGDSDLSEATECGLRRLRLLNGLLSESASAGRVRVLVGETAGGEAQLSLEVKGEEEEEGEKEEADVTLPSPPLDCTLREDDRLTLREDLLGHFALRFGCSAWKDDSGEDTARWWIHAESALFRRRLLRARREGQASVESLIAHCGASSWLKPEGLRNSSLYVCPWTRWPQGLKGSDTGKVSLTHGYVHLDSDSVIEVLVHSFEQSMQEMSKIAGRTLQYMDRGDNPDVTAPALRMAREIQAEANRQIQRRKRRRVLDSIIPPSYLDLVGEDGKGGKVLQHFPLCARSMMRRLLAEKHLKFHARLQLALYLKGCGLGAGDVAALWKYQGLSGVKYQKSLPGLWGLTGSRIDYTPYGCSNILKKGGASRAEEAHGCPFSHWEDKDLKKELVLGGIRSPDVEDIMNERIQRSAQAACLAHLTCLHPEVPREDIFSPNIWYEQSVLAAKETDRLP